MLICESSLSAAVRTFLREAEIPLPTGWSKEQDRAFLYNRIYPAFLKALEQIGEVQPCYGFDLANMERFERDHARSATKG